MMSYKDQEDLDTWLAEVEMAKEYVTKLASNEIDMKAFDAKQKKIEEEKLKEEEMLEKRKQGNPGKGESQNYHSFCKNCFWEYQLPTPQCLRCQKETMLQENRRKELLEKVDQYKKEKSDRAERAKKWDLWKKTQSMLWKKTSINYQKWDYFTDSSEEEKDKEPILPKNDPNFMALEKDLQERQQRTQNDKKNANKLKDQANKLMEEKNYKKAIEIYTEAIEIKRDFIALYTNRALAYIKLQKYDLAIQDCTKLLDYCECFEDGYTQSSNLTFKAFLRRSLCQKELKNYNEALKDVEEALKLDKDKQAIILKEEIQQIIKMDQRVTEIKDQVDDIDSKIKEYLSKDMTREQFVHLCVYLQSNPDNKIYFQKNYGIKKILQFIDEDKPCYLLINIFIENNPSFQEQFIKSKGVEKLYKKSSQKMQSEDQGEIFQNLTQLSLCDFPRNYMQNLPESKTLIQDLLVVMFENYEENPENLSSFVNLVSNFCYGGLSKTKSFLMDKIDDYLPLMQKVIECKKKRTKFLLLKENIYNLISNLLTDENMRKKLGTNKSFVQVLLYRLTRYDIQKDLKWVKSAEALLGVFINMLHEQIPQVMENFTQLNLVEKFITFFRSIEQQQENCTDVLNRVLNIFAKAEYNSQNFNFEFFQSIIIFLEKEYIEKGYTGFAIRILIKILSVSSLNDFWKQKLDKDIYDKLSNSLSCIILQDDEQRFCNSCNLGGQLIQIQSESAISFKQIIPRLITVARDQTGLKRRNASIFLAKLAKDKDNLQVIRQLHGIEVLQSVSKFIVNQ